MHANSLNFATVQLIVTTYNHFKCTESIGHSFQCKTSYLKCELGSLEVQNS